MGWNVTLKDLEHCIEIDGRSAEEWLPMLVGKLIKATVKPEHFRFPNGNDIRLRGFDGELRTTTKSLYIPFGDSVWEMSKSKTCLTKANEDFKKRDPDPQKTYVQLFSYPWSDAEKWREEAIKADWLDVRVIEGVQLIDWIENCPAVHRWLARKVNKRIEECFDAEDGWKIWSNDTEIPCQENIVIGDREGNIKELYDHLLGEACTINIIGSSLTDSKGFLYCAIKENDFLHSRFLEIKDKSCFLELVSGNKYLILLVPPQTEEIGYAITEGQHHIIYLHDLNNHYNANKVINLNPISYYTRKSALKQMNFDETRADAILENSNNKLEYIKIHPDLGPRSNLKFAWMIEIKYRNILKSLIVISHVNISNSEELEVFSNLTQTTKEECIILLESLSNEEGSPMKKYYTIYEVEAIFVIWLTVNSRFYNLNDLVLVYSKIFNFAVGRRVNEATYFNLSSTFKEKAASSLAFISQRLSVNSSGSEITLSEFEFITYNILRSSDSSLLRRVFLSLSEISPKCVIDYLEDLLQKENHKQLLNDLNGNEYTLFTALGMIAQQSYYLPRSCRILWKITTNYTDDNVRFRTIRKLSDILSLWNPQTSAILDDRILILQEFLEEDTSSSWRLLMEMLPSSRPSHRLNSITPKYRTWLRSNKASRPEIISSFELLSKIAIDKAYEHKLEYWPELISILFMLPNNSFNLAIQSIQKILSTGQSQIDIIAAFRSELLSLVNLEKLYWKSEPGKNSDKIKLIEDLLGISQPNPLFDLCFHIFSEWRPNLKELIGIDDSKTRQNILENVRKESLRNLYNDQGLEAIEKLVISVKNPSTFYQSFDNLIEFKSIDNLVKWTLNSDVELNQIAEQLIIWESKRDTLWIEKYSSFITLLDVDSLVKILIYCTLSKPLLNFLSRNQNISDKFWIQRRNFYIPDDSYEIINDIVSILLSIDRPIDALDCLYHAISHSYEAIKEEHIIRTLQTNVLSHSQYYSMAESWAFTLITWLRQRDLDEMLIIEIEWDYFEIIESNNGLPSTTLNKLIADPIFFVEYYLKRTEEIPNFQHSWEAFKWESRLENLYSMLHEYTGRSVLFDNSTYANDFVTHAKDRASKSGKIAKIDGLIGRMLAASPEDETDGIWPCLAVRLILEQVKSSDLIYGFYDGTISPEYFKVQTIRGGNDAFINEINKYMDASRELNIRYPKTSQILRDLADYYIQKND